MLESMRQAAQTWVAKLLFAVLVVSFGVWGIQGVFSGYGRGSIASVGSTHIPVEEFQRAYQNELDRFSREANKRIKGPNSLQHRYYREDFGHGLLPFLDLARIAGVKVPIASALFDLAGSLCGVDFRPSGRTAESMGIAGLTKSQLLKKVTVQ